MKATRGLMFEKELIEQNLTNILNEHSHLKQVIKSAKQRALLVDYLALLHKWNKAYNLTAVRDPQDMLIKHVFDALVVAEHLQGDMFIDVGTGAGIPGVILAIAFPDKTFSLLDGNGKKTRFLQHVKNTLGLSNIQPIHSRVENYQAELFDGVISRAFSSIHDMLFLCQHLCSNRGRFYAMKGAVPEEELAQLDSNFIVENIKALVVPTLKAERHLIILKNHTKN